MFLFLLENYLIKMDINKYYLLFINYSIEIKSMGL